MKSICCSIPRNGQATSPGWQLVWLVNVVRLNLEGQLSPASAKVILLFLVSFGQFFFKRWGRGRS